MKLTYDSIVPLLVEHVPALKPIYDEHMAANQVVLPHVFFGDLTRYVQAQFEQAPDSLGLPVILRILERAMSSPDPALQELVSVSFLENLKSDGTLSGMKRYLGPALTRELKNVRNKT